MINFSDMDAARIRKVLETQKGIIEFAEWAATVLAEAGIASSKAIGDTPQYACKRWSNVILKKALQIIEERQRAAAKIPGKAKALLGEMKALIDDRIPDR